MNEWKNITQHDALSHMHTWPMATVANVDKSLPWVFEHPDVLFKLLLY